VDAVLASVIAALEHDIGPACPEHAASLSRTCSQLLRQVRARLREEPAALREKQADLAGVLTSLGEPVTSAGAEELESRLAELVLSAVGPNDPARAAARQYVARDLRRRLVWERDAYTGPRR
jgi:hypothetical protein